MMEIKKINRLMLGIFLLHTAVVLFLSAAGERITMGVILSLSLGELILLAPALVYLLFYKIKGGKLKERLFYNKVKPSTLVYVVFFTWLSMPLTTLINAISMLFVDNTIMEMTDIILNVPFLLMLFLMAVLPAVVEELVYRGITYGGYRKNGTKFMAVLLSALMFGLMHMNLNQAMYAFVIGILLALLMEASGSMFTTMLFHFLYNAQSCCMMFLVEKIMPGYYQDEVNMTVTQGDLYSMISIYLILAAIFTPLSICMLYKIAKNENRVPKLMECLPQKQEGKERIVTVSYVLAVIVAAVFIAVDIVV